MSVDLTQLREGWEFEAKLAGGRDGAGTLPDSFWDTYSAMANTDGGKVVLGASERPDGSFDAPGIRNASRVEQNLWNLLDNRQKVSANILTRAMVERLPAERGELIVISIPRAPRTARPVYLAGNPFHAFRRSREGDRRCSEAEVRRMLADASDDPADGAIHEGYGVADLERGTLDAWRNLFRSRQPDHPFLAGDESALLTSLGAWRRDRGSGREGLTAAGLLMFGTERAILDCYPRYQLDYREVVDDVPGERWQDRVTIDGTWAGNVFAFFRRVFPKLTADLKVPFRLDAEMRRIDTTPAHEALREALVNALIHADYAGTRGIRVFKRRTSFELVNPGTLRVPWAEARAGNASDPRNPTLQKLFQLVGFGDRAGSGVPRILQAWREQHWRPPELTEDFEANETRLVLSTESLLPAAVVVELESRFGQRFAALNEAKRLALVTAAAEERVNNRRLQQVSELHPRDLTLLLGELVREGFLVPHGDGPGRSYTLPDTDAGTGAELPLFSVRAGLTSGGDLGSEPSSGQSSEQSSPSSAQRSGQSAPDTDPITQVRRTRWAGSDKAAEAVLALCRNQHLTPEEIATALGRKVSTVRRHYLGELIRSGRLVLLYPDSPNHPRQAYRTAPETPA